MTFVDVSAAYTRPARTLAAYHEVYAEQLQKTATLRAVADVQFGPDPDEWDLWTGYEAVFNRSFRHLPAGDLLVQRERDPGSDHRWRVGGPIRKSQRRDVGHERSLRAPRRAVAAAPASAGSALGTSVDSIRPRRRGVPGGARARAGRRARERGQGARHAARRHRGRGERPSARRGRRRRAAKQRTQSPALAADPRSVPASPTPARPACHAGGRGFESRRSRPFTRLVKQSRARR